MKGASRVPGPRYEALIELLRTADQLWNASRLFFARWDLSPSQFNVLNLLTDTPGGCTQVELSRQLLMHRSNVTGLIDRLENRGFVARHDSDTDRRAFRITLTKSGQRLLNEILPVYHAAAEAVWGDIPAERTRQLVAELKLVGANVEHAVTPTAPKTRPSRDVSH